MKMLSGRLTAALSAAALAVSAANVLPSALTAQAAGLSGLDAFQLQSQMTIGWNLGNTLDCSGTNLAPDALPTKFAKAWGNPVPTDALFQAVKDAGFNTVRIPTTWYEHLEWDTESKMYLVNDTWMDFVKQTVDYAYEKDMFVILNVHHEDWVNAGVWDDTTYDIAAKKLADIWTQVSETFADYDQHLIFEGMNEPRQTNNDSVEQWGDGSENDGYSQKYINNLNQIFVNTVRGQGSAANQERLLMLPGYCASSTFSAVRAIEIPENAGNVALSVHAYAPYYFTMATDSKANHEFPGASGWGENYESALSSLFTGLGQIQQEKNAPIIIGEFSASDFDNTEDRCRWAADYLTKAKAQGIPCVLWDNNVVGRKDGEAHGYIYRENNTWYTQSKPVVQAMMDVYGVTSVMPDYVEVLPPEFNWDDIAVGDDWKEMYRKDSGKALADWGNVAVRGWDSYLDGSYDIAVVYVSDSEPELVLQDAAAETWNRIQSSDDSETDFVKLFTYEDIENALDAAGVSLSDMANFYVSATMESMTVYGVYAVPREAETTEPTETTEPPTETTTESIPETTGYVNERHFSIEVYDQETYQPLSGVKVLIETNGSSDTLTTTGEWLIFNYTLTNLNPQISGRVSITDVPEGYAIPDKIEVIDNYTTSISFGIPRASEDTTESTAPAEGVMGDVNGDSTVDIMDVIALNKYLLSVGELDNNAKKLADVDGSGEIDSVDALTMLKFVAKIITAF